MFSEVLTYCSGCCILYVYEANTTPNRRFKMTNAAALPAALHAAAVETKSVDLVCLHWLLIEQSDRLKIAQHTDKWKAFSAFGVAMERIPLCVVYDLF